MVSARARNGFTLIELTLAMVLLAFGLLALVGALVHALDEAQRARVRHAALRQAEGLADSVVAAGGAYTGARRIGPARIEWRAEDCAAGSCVRFVSTIPGHARDTVELLVRARAAPDTP